MKKDLRKLFVTAKARGWVIERTRSDHWKLLHPPTGAIVYSGTTPSCDRALRNLRADIAMIERQTQGVAHD